MGISEENGTTFSYQTEPTNGNVSYSFVFFFRIPQLRQRTSLSKMERKISVPPEVIPNVPVKKPKRTFHLNSDRNVRNFSVGIMGSTHCLHSSSDSCFVSVQTPLRSGNLSCVFNFFQENKGKKEKADRIKETKKNIQRDGVFNTYSR